MAIRVGKTVIQVARYQNVCATNYAIQNCNYSTKPAIIKNPTTASLKRGTGGRSSFNGLVCTIFGCNGFIGRYVCNRLGKIGTQIIIPYRCERYHVLPLKVCGDLGQILFHPFHLNDEESLRKSMKYSNVVINLIGAKTETNNFSFHDVHVEGARKIAKIAKECNVERLIHVSCLNVEKDPKPLLVEGGSNILKTKWMGEQVVKEEFPEATIIRPSVVYGQEDDFINHYMHPFRKVYRFLPLWRKGEKTEKQPVNVTDVAAGIVAVVKDRSTMGKTYQFVGPKRYKLSSLVSWFFDIVDPENKTIIITDFITNPFFYPRVLMNELIYKVHPSLTVTWELLELQHTSDKVDPTLPTLEDLGITPCDMESQMDWQLQPFRYIDEYRVVPFDPVPDPETIPLKKKEKYYLK